LISGGATAWDEKNSIEEGKCTEKKREKRRAGQKIQVKSDQARVEGKGKRERKRSKRS